MHPSPELIERREAIRRVALLLGGTVAAPAALGVLAGCGGDATRDAASGAWSPRALSAQQVELVATIAEHIIPQTSTAGAGAAGVHRFIDTMLADYYAPDERARFLAGLAEVDARAGRTGGRPFLRCRADEQLALVEALDREAFAPLAPAAVAPPPAPDRETQRGASGTPPAELKTGTARRAPTGPAAAPPPFFRTMKELTLLGYYTSEAGATRELRHAQVPGRFEGCVPLARVGRAWAV